MYYQFENYLQKLGVTKKSIKNYKSDVSQFLSWVISKLKTLGTYAENLSEVSPFLTPDLVNDYVNFMSSQNNPQKTINRRLSTLRHLSKFLISAQLIEFDFMDGRQNLSTPKANPVVSLSDHHSVTQFRAFLEAEKVSKNTVKNYVSDVKQFLSWLEKNHHAQSS